MSLAHEDPSDNPYYQELEERIVRYRKKEVHSDREMLNHVQNLSCLLILKQGLEPHIGENRIAILDWLYEQEDLTPFLGVIETLREHLEKQLNPLDGNSEENNEGPPTNPSAADSSTSRDDDQSHVGSMATTLAPDGTGESSRRQTANELESVDDPSSVLL